MNPGDDGAATDLGLLRSSSSTTVTPAGDFTTISTVAYNALHQVESTTVTLTDSPEGTTLMGDLAGLDYTTAVEYDDLGQVTSTEMPALGGLPNEKSVIGYRLSGQAQTLTLEGVGASTSTTLVSAVAFNGTGQLQSRTYGNGVTRSIGWNDVTGQVSVLSASFETGEGETLQTNYVQADTFTRDAVGRITQIASAVPNGGEGATALQVTGQCFTHDGFNRLASAWTIAGTGTVGACGTAAPTSDTDPAWDASATAYATSWDYSDSGQITSIINGAASPVEATLTYGEGSAPADAVTTMSDGATTNTYAYDGAGRQVTRTLDGEATTLSWDVSSNLVQTSGAGGDQLYVYDASGSRVAKIQVPDTENQVTGAVTAYVGSTELTDADTSVNATDPADLEGAGFIMGTRYYTFGGATVAVRQVAAGEGATSPEPDPTPTPTPAPTPSPSPSPSATPSPSPSPSTSPSPSPSVSASVTPSPSPSPSVSPSASPSPSPTPSPTPTPTPSPSPSPSEPPATPTVATSTLSLLFGDEQGSAQVMMQVTLDASGAMNPALDTDLVTRNAYTPYGAVRGADNLSIDHGWLNKIADTDTGLTYLGARYYDPLTSRFLSPDPLMNPADPRTLDAYMYANNNPVLFSDPTGLTPYYQGNTKILDEYYVDGSQYKNPNQTSAPVPPSGGTGKGSQRSRAHVASDYLHVLLSRWFASEDGQTMTGFARDSLTTDAINLGIGCVSSGKKWDCATLVGLGMGSGSPMGFGMSCVSPIGTAIGNATIAKGILARNFPGGAEWDAKIHLRGFLALYQGDKPKTGDTADKWLPMNGEREIYYDAFGSFAFGIMMQRWGISAENATGASEMGGIAGEQHPEDVVSVQLGYAFAEAHPTGFTSDDLWASLSSAQTVAALEEAGVIVPLGAESGIRE